MQSRTLSWNQGHLKVALELEEGGSGASLVLLPALSSICTKGEMRPLAQRLAAHFQVRIVDWPGFGELPRPRADWSAALLCAYLRWLLEEALAPPHMIIAAGHAATYALALCAARPGLITRLVLVAPTWRGPLPTMMGGQRPWFATLRGLLDNPIVGPLLYRLNVSAPVVRHMAREHVYQQSQWLQGARLDAKLAVTRARGARHASVRFVSGALDMVGSRAQWLALAAQVDIPILQVYGEHTPRRSRAEMESLAQLSQVRSVRLPHGRLAVHEEYPDEVAAAVLPFLNGSS
jgi:pimeloyl-ACP methyl ester carboxylesterase